ncbi:MAG: hypothetical protein ABSD64_10010, partial [Terriglobales bacterium]
QGLEPENEPRPRHHRLALHSQTSTLKVRLQKKPYYAVTVLVGRIEGQQEGKGIQFAFEDLVIGVTALHLGYAVMTLNARHFQRIPGLSVV